MLDKVFDVLNRYDTATEAISPQIDSKFKKDLIDIFELGFEFRKSIDPNVMANQGEIAMRNYKAFEMSNYVKKYLIPEFSKLVNTHTGLLVSKVFVHSDVNTGPIGLFAVDISFGDWKAASTTMDRVTGIKKGDFNDSVTNMMQMANNFDTTSGKITNNKFGNKKISVKIYFDALFAYCLHDFLPVAAEEFTAEELAAIMLHEIGHALTFIERSGDWFFTQKRLVEHLENTTAHRDITEAIDTIYPEIKKSLLTIIKEKDINKKHIAFLIKCMDKMEKISNKVKDIKADTSVTIFSGIVNILYPLFLGLVLYFPYTIAIFVFVKLATQLTDAIDLNSAGKTSDTASSRLNISFCERMADEYVTMHGASRALASALSKLYKSGDYLILGSISSVTIRNSIMFNLYFKLMAFLLTIPFNIASTDTYEENYQRLARIAQNNIKLFKDPKLPAYLRQELVSDHEEVLRICKDNKGLLDTKVGASIWYMLEALSDPVVGVKIILSGNLRRDYEKLSNKVDEICNNKMYFQYQKLLTFTDN